MERHPQPLRRSSAVLIVAPALLLVSLNPCLTAQDLASNDLPDAPSPEIRASIAILPAAPRPPMHRRLTWNNTSVSVLLAGEALDSWTTYTNLTHHKWICGYSPAFGNAVTYISDDGKRYDPPTIQHDLCGPSPSGRLANYAYDVTRTGAYTETGWVTTMGLSNNRNASGVLAWNIANDVGQIFVARYLAKRSKLVRRIAPGINFARGIYHFDCGIQNIQFARTHSNASTWQFRLPNEATLYPGPRWWGRQ